MGEVKVVRDVASIATIDTKDIAVIGMDVEKFLDSLPEEPLFDLVVTSPPYNIGKEYEKKVALDQYIEWQRRIIQKIYIRLKDTGSICWQVGNYVDNGAIIPLDFEFAPIFKELNMQLRNRIIWHFGHGLHSKKRFSGRYEVVLWYTKTDKYTFNLDAVRVPSKYPGKDISRGLTKASSQVIPSGKIQRTYGKSLMSRVTTLRKLLTPASFPLV